MKQMSTGTERREQEGGNKKILLRNLKLFMNRAPFCELKKPTKKKTKDNKMELFCWWMEEVCFKNKTWVEGCPDT